MAESVAVKIPVEFIVTGTDDERVAKQAAATAAWDFLAFCTALNVNSGRDECEVQVDGHGTLKVMIGEEHG